LDCLVSFILFKFSNHFLHFLAREYFGMSAKIRFYDRETGEDTIHIVDETPISFYGTYIVPKSSPFISIFNKVIHIAHEAGLIRHAIKSSFYTQELQKIDRIKKRFIQHKKLQVIKIYHLRDVSLFWIICVILCLIVFVIEIIYCKILK
jgi:hypothetical protein